MGSFSGPSGPARNVFLLARNYPYAHFWPPEIMRIYENFWFPERGLPGVCYGPLGILWESGGSPGIILWESHGNGSLRGTVGTLWEYCGNLMGILLGILLGIQWNTIGISRSLRTLWNWETLLSPLIWSSWALCNEKKVAAYISPLITLEPMTKTGKKIPCSKIHHGDW